MVVQNVYNSEARAEILTLHFWCLSGAGTLNFVSNWINLLFSVFFK